MTEWSESDVKLDDNIAIGLVQFIAKAIQSNDSGDLFLRARGYLVAGTLSKATPNVVGAHANSFLEQTIQAATQDPEGVVQISCLKVLQK